jgi:hypothetical protein
MRIHFLLSEAQTKNAVVNPSPKFGHDCQIGIKTPLL